MAPALAAGAYIDSEQRYQLLEPLPPLSTKVQVKVLDCQPLQLSPLTALVNSAAHPVSPPPADATSAEALMAKAIPSIAKAYLALQSQFPQSVAAIHDAWQQEHIQVVLIEDYSDRMQLIELWADEKTTSLQILPWLYKITQLWAALEPWHCRQSLLELSNLRVTKDKALVLQRLDEEIAAGESLTLQDLGRVWQELFHASQRTQFGSLIQLLDELKAGNIQSIDELQLRLQAIANELQINSIAPPVVPSTPTSSEPIATTAQVAATPTSAPTVLQLAQPENKQMQSDDMPTVMLPMQLMSIEDVGCTDVGRQRHHNEDCFGIETTIIKQEDPQGRTIQARGLYILCDGMGGHAAGEVASALAVKTLRQYFQTHWHSQQLPDEATIREAVERANQAIYELNQSDTRSGTGRMGTTLVMLLLQDTKIAVAHVGDSRLYRFRRKQGLEQVTVDHEVGQREILQGVEPEIAYARPDAFQLTQALGPRDRNFVKPDVKFLELNEDILLLLASDGLCDNELLEKHWQTHLDPLLSSTASLENGAHSLIELANQYNGHDNITALLVRAKVRPDMEQHQKV